MGKSITNRQLPVGEVITSEGERRVCGQLERLKSAETALSHELTEASHRALRPALL